MVFCSIVYAYFPLGQLAKNLINLGGILVLSNFFIRVWMLTVSNALLMFRATRTVLFGGSGLLLLNPSPIVLVILWRAVVLEK